MNLNNLSLNDTLYCPVAGCEEVTFTGQYAATEKLIHLE